jgi:hypothetical protein
MMESYEKLMAKILRDIGANNEQPELASRFRPWRDAACDSRAEQLVA